MATIRHIRTDVLEWDVSRGRVAAMITVPFARGCVDPE